MGNYDKFKNNSLLFKIILKQSKKVRHPTCLETNFILIPNFPQISTKCAPKNQKRNIFYESNQFWWILSIKSHFFNEFFLQQLTKSIFNFKFPAWFWSFFFEYFHLTNFSLFALSDKNTQKSTYKFAQKENVYIFFFILKLHCISLFCSISESMLDVRLFKNKLDFYVSDRGPLFKVFLS